MKAAPDHIKHDKDCVLAAVKRNGNCLYYASKSRRADKDCVLAAVSSKPESLKYALGGLNQDHDCLVRAGLWDPDYRMKQFEHGMAPKIVLSTKFSLGQKSSRTATQFTILLKKRPFFQRGFVIYSPNAYTKSTCDPEWTRLEWPCRGTHNSCQFLDTSLKTGKPRQSSCWRYSYRWQLVQAKRTNGFMLQIVERIGDICFSCPWGEIPEETVKEYLGRGQQIESIMAKEVGIKVFRVYLRETNHVDFNVEAHINEVIDDLEDNVSLWLHKEHQTLRRLQSPLTSIRKVG